MVLTLALQEPLPVHVGSIPCHHGDERASEQTDASSATRPGSCLTITISFWKGLGGSEGDCEETAALQGAVPLASLKRPTALIRPPPARDRLWQPDSLIPFSYSLNLSSLSGRGSAKQRAGAPAPINLHITADRMVLITYWSHVCWAPPGPKRLSLIGLREKEPLGEARSGKPSNCLLPKELKESARGGEEEARGRAGGGETKKKVVWGREKGKI